MFQKTLELNKTIAIALAGALDLAGIQVGLVVVCALS